MQNGVRRLWIKGLSDLGQLEGKPRKAMKKSVEARVSLLSRYSEFWQTVNLRLRIDY